MNQVTASRKKTAGSTLITTSFQYDSMFNVTQVTDPKGQNYRYRYNALGWLIRQEDPATKRDTMQYSVDGDVRRVTNRRNLNIDFTYDSLHRAKTRVGTASMSYAYPLNGRRIVGVSPVATDTIFLNVRGQPDSAVTRMAAQRYARRYHYTSAGLPDSLYGYGGVTLTTRGYGWDVAKGVLTGIKLGTSLTSISPDAGLQDSAIVLPGTAGTIGRTFGSLHAPVKITSSQHPPAERWLGFDALGRVSEHLKQGGTSGRFFVYDSLGRYQKAADSSTTGTPPAGCPDLVGGSLLCNNGLIWTYTAGTLAVDTMDLVGNRTSKGGTYTAGTNRITGFDGCTYVTATAGSDSVRTCGASVTNFGWNAEGQLTSLAVTGQATATFDYDAFGRLVRKSSGGSPAAFFVWDGMNLVAEVGSTGTTLTAEYSYYPGMDRLHAVIVAGTRHYAYADGLGNVQRLGSEAGGLSRTFTYDDWGKITATTDGASLGSKDRTRWKGALWFGEETELYYMRNRWYEPRTGRFVSEDPIGLAGGINPFAYASNDPVGGADPTGLCVRKTYIFSTLDNEGNVTREVRMDEWDCSGSGRDGMRHGSWGETTIGRNVTIILAIAGVAVSNLDPGVGGRSLHFAANCSAGFGDAVTGFTTYGIREIIGGNEAVDFQSSAYQGCAIAGMAATIFGYARGPELSSGRDFRLAPWGNRTGGIGELPHYHQRFRDPSGKPVHGGGIGKHRPWEGIRP